MSEYPAERFQFVGYLNGVAVYGATNTSELSISPYAGPLTPYGERLRDAALNPFPNTLASRMAADLTQDWT